MKTARHSWLYAAAVVLVAFAAGARTAQAEDTIKIGILHSLSGTMAISETIIKDLMLMEVADVNAKGGLLGKKIEPDFAIEQDPKAVAEGHDPQLEKAVALALDALAKHPVAEPHRPAYPNYHKQ